jgi:hypothetical protein
LSFLGAIGIYLVLYFFLFIGGPVQESLYPLFGELAGFVLIFVLAAFALLGFVSGLLLRIVVFRLYFTRREVEAYFARVPNIPNQTCTLTWGSTTHWNSFPSER